ncbi:MAG: fumarate hydratase [Candidatus Omnitrophica bacterium]|nr:fumarate hydratase [Candidatus Omnitrophota bacterium]
MRRINTKDISALISRLCIGANTDLRPDIKRAIEKAAKREKDYRAKRMLRYIINNADMAKAEGIPICQDTGLAVVLIEMGQGVMVEGGFLGKAVDEGVRKGYIGGYLRKSVVSSPLVRKNTGTNAPAILHTEIIPGESMKIWVMPKGFGSENKSQIRMLSPGDGEEGVIKFVKDVVKDAGPAACPPFVLGIGMGGTFDYAAFLAKKAMLRDIDKDNKDERLASLEKKIMKEVNALGIGPMGLGGKTTAIGVNILSHPTHIAGMPVAVNVNCHATRAAYGEL